MQDKTLLKTALITSLVGLLLLFFLAQRIDFDKESLISSDSLEKNIKITGKVIGVQASEDLTKIKIITEQELDIVIFGELNIGGGLIIEASGKLKEYKGQFELMAEEIKIINQTSYLNS